MPAPSTLKHEFLKKWAMGLQLCCSLKKDMSMSISERKKAIKLSADVAMAIARNGRTHWSRALIANAYKDKDAKIMVNQMLGRSCADDDGDQSHENQKKIVSLQIGSITRNKRVMSKKILKRSCCVGRPRKMRRAPHMAPLPTSVAKRLVKKRTQVLKSLVPGTHAIDDELSLFEETLDYIVSLQAQVDVMRQVAHANGHK